MGADVTEPEERCHRARLPPSHSWKETGSDSSFSRSDSPLVNSRNKSHFLGLWLRWFYPHDNLLLWVLPELLEPLDSYA